MTKSKPLIISIIDIIIIIIGVIRNHGAMPFHGQKLSEYRCGKDFAEDIHRARKVIASAEPDIEWVYPYHMPEDK
jgi:hypothetical protein